MTPHNDAPAGAMKEWPLLGIRERRMAAGMSLRELAAAVGISSVEMGEYERGVRLPTMSTAAAISRAISAASPSGTMSERDVPAERERDEMPSLNDLRDWAVRWLDEHRAEAAHARRYAALLRSPEAPDDPFGTAEECEADAESADAEAAMYAAVLALLARQEAREPDIEALAEAVHDAYLATCARLGWDVKPENRVPYAELSEDSKELDRASVRAVLAGLAAARPAPEDRETAERKAVKAREFFAARGDEDDELDPIDVLRGAWKAAREALGLPTAPEEGAGGMTDTEAKATLSDAEVARIIEAVEAHCGMGRGAWDMVAARDLVEGFAAALGADTRRIDASETLLPCPFCGGEAVRITTRYSENCDTVKANGGQALFHGVKCIVCGARTSTVVGYRTPGKADAAWNRRTEAATVSSETMLTASCVWTVDEDGNYHTACDGMFIILEGTPRENGMSFCCYCGRTLTEADGRAPDTQTEGDDAE